MKKLFGFLSLLLVFTMLLSPVCFAAGDNTDTLADWEIRVSVPDGKTAVLKGREYYIYAREEGYIPYVMLTTYSYDSEEEFIPAFTSYMQTQYKDLKISAEAQKKTIGGKACHEIDYSYTVSGYEIADRRVVITVGGRTYVFTSKEVPSRGLTVDGMLEQVVADCEFLSEAAALPEPKPAESSFADAYLCCQEDGMPKYWLDLTGTYANNLVLHCYFRSSDPGFYESRFILDLGTADLSEDAITIRKVTDQYGLDHSDWFKTLLLRQDGDALIMEVERDDRTLAGGGEDNILTGSYRLEPVGARPLYEFRRDDGLRKYWLDLSGEAIKLHAMFLSGEPEYYEKVFTFDPDSMKPDGKGRLVIGKVFDENENEVTEWFQSLSLTVEADGSVTMEVERDARTLAGGAEDNILSGSYRFVPRVYLQPAHEAPYSAEELARWAQIGYFMDKGFFPPEADVEKNDDGSYTIHLYEIVEIDDIPMHTATAAWYTVDAGGVGADDIFGNEVRLFG